MNKDTLLKLKSNPFYKMSPDQERQLAELEEADKHSDSNIDSPRMVEIGMPPKHYDAIPKHDVKIARRKNY